jgi:hypothetical protein
MKGGQQAQGGPRFLVPWFLAVNRGGTAILQNRSVLRLLPNASKARRTVRKALTVTPNPAQALQRIILPASFNVVACQPQDGRYEGAALAAFVWLWRAGVFARGDSACLMESVCPKLGPAYFRLQARFARRLQRAGDDPYPRKVKDSFYYPALDAVKLIR